MLNLFFIFALLRELLVLMAKNVEKEEKVIPRWDSGAISGRCVCFFVWYAFVVLCECGVF